MSSKTIGALLSLALLTTGLACAKDSPDQQREKIRKMAAETLTICTSFKPRLALLSRTRQDTQSSTTWAQISCCSARRAAREWP